MFKHLALASVVCCASLAAITAHAECDKGSKTVFSCVSKNGKLIQVCDSKKTITYSFGKPKAKPEIVLTVPRNVASMWQRRRGPSEHYSVSIPNGNTTYMVYYYWNVLGASADGAPLPSAELASADNISTALDAGVSVTINGKEVANVACAGEVSQEMEGIDLKPTE